MLGGVGRLIARVGILAGTREMAVRERHDLSIGASGHFIKQSILAFIASICVC